MKKQTIAGAALVAALALPAAARAHVTLQPKAVAAGGFTVLDVRVPTERDDAATVKVDLQLPDGFAEASYQSTPGWTVTVHKQRLAKPIQTDDGPVTEEVKRITWTADSKADGIQPGQFRDFPLSVQVPGRPGDTLTFKALQTYSSGEIVRWIGAADSDTPAPTVSLTAATPAGAAKAPAASSGGGGASKGLGIAALVVAIVAAALGATSLALRRRAA
jgi:uncharacterized protein